MQHKARWGKLLGAALIVLGSSCISTGIASAESLWSSSIQWGAQQGTYSPDFGNTAIYEYNSWDGLHFIKPMARFRFDQNAVSAIKNYKSSKSWYYTFDISDTNDSSKNVSAVVGNLYSTLPNPYFDVDDDPVIPNGYNDESEVVSLSCESILPNIDYRFESYFKVYNSYNTTTLAFTSQESEYQWYAGVEYNAQYHNEHLTRLFPFNIL